MFDDILEKHKLKKEKKKEELEKQLNRITDLKQDKDKQIADLAELVKYTEDDVVQAQIIDTLSTYGKKAISAITEIVNKTQYDKIKEFGLKIIAEIKENK